MVFRRFFTMTCCRLAAKSFLLYMALFAS
jgi:hypothetical protein